MKKYLFSTVFLFVLQMNPMSYAQLPGTIKWAFDFQTGSVYQSVALADDGTIYACLNYTHNVIAINSDGTQKWIFTAGDDVESAPCVGVDGTIYFGCENGELYALNPDGTEKWTFSTPGNTLGIPVEGPDGTIYFFCSYYGSASFKAKLYAVNSDGTEKWHIEFNDNYLTIDTPVIGPDGTIYAGDYDLLAIHPDGWVEWTYEHFGHLAIGADGTIYIATVLNGLYAVNPDGTEKWQYRVSNDNYNCQPVIDHHGALYLLDDDNRKLYCLNPDGTLKWDLYVGDHLWYTAAIGADGIIYFVTGDDELFALNPDGTEAWKSIGDSSPVIVDDGTIYVGVNQNLYAIISSSHGLADSPWPRFQQNNQNTGRYNYMSLLDEVSFHFVAPGQSIQKQITFNNTTDQNIILIGCTMSSDAYALLSNLPITVAPNSSELLTVSITPDVTNLYQSDCQMSYEKNGNTGTLSGYLQAGIFLEDQSEQALVAKKVYETYLACDQEEDAVIAKQNNRGLLYRFLGSFSTANQILQSALTSAQNNNYGYTGIKMNYGVVWSDLDDSEQAMACFTAAWQDVNENESESALAPPIYYNEAWEYYRSEELENASTLLEMAIGHANITDFCKAKAYVLRGAVNYQQGQTEAAKADFQQAVALDPDGPIGRLAQENLDALETGVGDIITGLPCEFVLSPNHPNPFNPETTVSFDLPRDSEVELTVYNVLGRQVRALIKGNRKAGWHTLKWNGLDESRRQVGTGIYLLMMSAGGFKSVQKMMLVR